MTAAAAPVPREALAQPKRRYCCSARRLRAAKTREALLDAAVELIASGDFRPEAAAIAARAKVHPATINRHFSAAHLLFRVVARERTAAVLEALGLVATDDARTMALQADLVWIAMTGRRRDGWG
jgi:AcrR family transcriptional regulator